MKHLLILFIFCALAISCNDSNKFEGSVSAETTPQDEIKFEGTDTGGGGNHVVQDVYRVAQNVLYELDQLNESDNEAKNLFVQFDKVLSNLKVISASYLELNGKEVTAINIANKGKLYVSRSHWIQIPTEQDKFAFIIHELLGLAKISDPESYTLSNRWAKILYPNIPDVCGRSTPLVKTLELAFDKSCDSITLEDLASIQELEIINSIRKVRLSPPDGKYSTGHSLLEDKLSSIVHSQELPSKLWSLRHNDLKGMSNLKKLKLKNSNLVSVDSEALIDLVNVESLDLSYNSLSHLPEQLFGSLVKLQNLDISNNKFKGFVYPLSENLGQLKFLKLSNNTEVELISTDFLKGLVYLEELFMDNLASLRHLEPNTFIELESLTYLNLNGSSAYLENDSLNGLSSLKTLELESWSAKTSGEPKSFRDLSLNFKTFPRDIFKPLPNLIDLSLRFSDVENLSLDMFSENNMLELVCAPDSKIESYGCINFLTQYMHYK